MKRLFSLCLVASMLACSSKKDVRIPSAVLSQPDMVKILTDIHTVDAALSANRIPNPRDTMSFLLAKPYYERIFSNHHTDAQTFERSLSFYIQHVGLLDSTYDLVISQASLNMSSDTSRKRLPGALHR